MFSLLKYRKSLYNLCQGFQNQLIFTRNKSKNKSKMVCILNVAEKNDAAKNLANIISRGGFNRREGFSQYNKIYEFPYMLNGQQCQMVMTSVSGHVLNHAFVRNRNWQSCNPVVLFDTPVTKTCNEDSVNVKRTLEREVKKAHRLIIWTDCDREGENIGFEIIDICRAIKPNIPVERAIFSEITQQSIQRALQTLAPPDHRQNNAVNVRAELDLRIGAAFTRFQTLRLQKVFPNNLADTLISYGSCQFPTLGFVVERYKAIQEFIPERFWKIKVTDERDNNKVDFIWKRVRLFNQLACQVLLDQCEENPTATVTNVLTKPKSKWRPVALDTVELEKLGSRKLKIDAKETMRIAEKLYTSGFISYPRTETNIFPPELNLVPLVEMQTGDPRWGEFAGRVLQDGLNPRNGKKTDKAHPPIHPIKYAANLDGNEKRLYEFIVRHFLACVSKDAKGYETIVTIDIATEIFTSNGLMIVERNYLDVYIYENWSDKTMPHYEIGSTFQPSNIEMNESETNPPSLLTEADLIALMEKHGIGTDATHADHIETIKNRMYVGVQESKFIPGELGMGLVEGYDAMGFEMSKPYLRSGLEADLKKICDGEKDPAVVLAAQIEIYRDVFKKAVLQANKIDEALGILLNTAPVPIADREALPTVFPVCKCLSCNECCIVIRNRSNNQGFYLSCEGFPNCKNVRWLPACIESMDVTSDICPNCRINCKKVKFKFKKNAFFPILSDEYSGCLGCDTTLLETLGITSLNQNVALSQSLRNTQTNRGNSQQDSGYGSMNFSNSSHSSSNNFSQRTRVNTNNTQSQNRTHSINNSNFSQSFPSNNTNNFSQPSTQPTNDNDIVCLCNQRAIILTVRKEGKNTGRQFYKCAKPQGEGCNFFSWAEGDDTSISNPRPVNASQTTNTQNRDILNTTNTFGQRDQTFQDNKPECRCSLPAVERTVQKDGPNKGKQFFTCSKGMGESCGYFKWSEEFKENTLQPNFNNPSTSTNRTQGVKRKANPSEPKKRKCGVCGEVGHNRKNCPYNQL